MGEKNAEEIERLWHGKEKSQAERKLQDRE